MFATSGYFRAISCPFYVNGLCERPFCHFRHTKQDSEKTKDDVPSYSTAGVRSNSPVEFGPGTKPYAAQQATSDDSYFTSSESSVAQSTAPKSSTELLRAGIEQSFAIPSFTDSTAKYPIPSADEEPEQYMTASPEKKKKKEKSALQSKYPLPETDDEAPLPAYLPTPKTPSLPPASSKLPSSVPEYQPTPKRELKRRNGDPRRVADMEYDPESNFSCGGLSKNHSENDDSFEYKPTRKKAKLMGRNSRLSCDSLKEYSPDRELSGVDEDEDDDEGPPDGEFSEDEPESQAATEKMQGDNICEDFENIDDDDISSDDDLIEVASGPATPSGNKESSNGRAKKRASSKTSDYVSLKSGAQQDVRTNSSGKSSSKSVKNSQRSDLSKSKSHPSEKPKGKSSQRHSGSSSSTNKKSSSSKSLSSSKHDSSKKSKTLKHSTSKDKHNSSSSKSGDSVKGKSDNSSSKKNSASDIKSHSSAVAVKKSSSSSTKRDSAEHKHLPHGKLSGSGSSRSSSASVNKSSSSHSKVNDKEGNRRDSTTSEKSVSLGRKGSRSDSYNGSGGFLGSVQTKLPETHSSGSVHKNESGNRRKSSTENSASVKRTSSTDSSASAKRRNSTEKQKSNKPDSSSQNLLKKPFAPKQDAKIGSGKTLASGMMLGIISSGTDYEDHRFHDSEITDSSPRTSPTKHTQSKQGDKQGAGKNLLHRMNSALFGEDTSDNENNGFQNDDIYGQESQSAPIDVDVDLSNFIHDSDFEEEDTFDECLRIFKESAAQLGPSSKQNKQLQLTKDGSGKKLAAAAAAEPAVGKKRVAHSAADQARRSDVKKERPRQHLSAAQVMHNRIMEMQRRALERATKQAVQEQKVSSTSGTTPKSTSASALTSTSQGQGGEKKRVAHLPKPPEPSPSTSKEKSATVTKKGEKTVTIATTASKTEKRIAHAPNLSNLKRPVIPASFGSKVPSNIRQRYLNLIIDECFKFCSSEEEAYKRGLEEESGVYDRATNKNIYLRVAVNTITRLRSEAKELMMSEPSSSTLPQRRLSSNAQSHQATIGGSRAAKTSFTLHRSSSSGKKIEVALTGAELYEKLSKYCLTEEQLVNNGYPQPSPDTPGKAVCHFTKYKDTDTLLRGNERTCARCGTRFMVHGDGSYVSQEECVYHWTRAYLRKKSGFIQHIYNCCSSDTSSRGCQIALNHVHEKNKQDNLTGFMRTIPHSPPLDGNYGVYALDCEMVYSQGGLELARVTVIDTEGKSVYESLVQPFSPIVDYNTRFSGLTKADLKDIKTTLTDVQAILLSMFSDKTILIGHSLESDLFALKLIHLTVVDTSVVFPHRLGPPYKRALKNLMLETFQKIIQSDDGGHDSKEDAVACLDLMKWRMKEDSRRENRYS